MGWACAEFIKPFSVTLSVLENFCDKTLGFFFKVNIMPE